MATHNPYNEFINFQRTRDGYSQLEKSDEGLRHRRPTTKPQGPTQETSFINQHDIHDAELGRVITSNYRTFNINGNNVNVPLGSYTAGDKLVLAIGGASVFIGATGLLYYIITSIGSGGGGDDETTNPQEDTNDEIYKSGINLPFHKFVGPGNTIGKAQPVDRDDQIALIHDIRYKGATARPDIVAADNDAIHEFEDDFKKTGNWHSKIAETGLRIKQGVEHITGPLYPKLTGI